MTRFIDKYTPATCVDIVLLNNKTTDFHVTSQCSYGVQCAS